MTFNVINNSPYLRTSREYPQDDLHQLSVEVNKSYVDIALAVNNRTIGLFPVGRPAINGEAWFITSQKQQGLRQVYTISGTGNVAHNINAANIYAFTRIYGTFTDGTIWYPLPYVDVANANNQINITVTSTNIVITAGGGSPPSIVSGFVVLEWIVNV
jgi:hypothetical protein